MSRDNKHRAYRGRSVFDFYRNQYNLHNEEVETIAIDIITDMLHALDRHYRHSKSPFGYSDAHSILTISEDHFTAERET